MSVVTEKAEVFREKIITWYRLYGDRNLPWRSTSDAWAVLVAAFLLRKTTVRQVVKIYEVFIKRYPAPSALLQVSMKEVEDLIRPLGIEHQRGKQLIELAKCIIERFKGNIPCSKEKLKELPGVGDYIASEVLLVSCNQPEPLLDRNMIRVLERVFGIKSIKKRSHTDPALWSFAKELVPQDPVEARDFNYGVLDFARKVCSATNPKCAECPLAGICAFRKIRETNVS